MGLTYMSIGSVSAARKEIRQLAQSHKHEEMLLNNDLTSTNHTTIYTWFSMQVYF